MITEVSRTVEFSVLYAEVLEQVKYSLAVVTEYNCTVMRIVLLDENVSVESAHFLDAEDTDSTEGSCSYRKDLALCSVGSECSIGSGLKSEECNSTGLDVAFESTSRDIRLAAALKTTDGTPSVYPRAYPASATS